jgi:hypothetical protein
MPRKKSLKSTIRELAVQFADGLAEALEERISSAPSSSLPLARPVVSKRAMKSRGTRAAVSLEAASEKLLAVIGRSPGLRNEQLQKETGLPGALTGRVLTQLRNDKRVKTKGTRRAMVYLPA